MIGLVMRAAGLLAVYLLVLTSVAPGDVVVGAALGVAVATALRPRHRKGERRPWTPRARAFAASVLTALAEVVRGTGRTARFCLSSAERSGFVEIPREDRSPNAVALWGILTGESPDELVVDVDSERDLLVVHLVDASDPDGVRERHHREYERRQRKAVT